jgi:hypothetical protein
MHILIGLALAVALLFFWLGGHWFARVLTFLLFATMLGFILGWLTPPSYGEHYNQMGVVIGIALAWPIAGIPTYYWRAHWRRYYGIKRQATAR